MPFFKLLLRAPVSLHPQGRTLYRRGFWSSTGIHAKSLYRCQIQPQSPLLWDGVQAENSGLSVFTAQMSSAPVANPSPNSSKPNRLIPRQVVLLLKAVFLWVPAAYVWVYLALLYENQTRHDMTDEEVEEARLRCFYGVQHLSENEAVAEFTVKEEAIYQIKEKLLRTQRFLSLLSESATESQVQISFVFPPPDSGDRFPSGTVNNSLWSPRLAFAHPSGTIALVSLEFKFLEGGKNREERWVCTLLRCHLITGAGGAPVLGEQIFDFSAPPPDGIQDMKL